MALQIVREDQGKNQEEISGWDDAKWEEECYDHGCRAAREAAIERLKAIDERLLRERPKNWKVKRFCQRTLLTRFGKITVTRRLYLDDKGEYRFLLDEYMNWRPKQEATVSLTEALVDSSTYLPFRKVSREAEKYSAGVLSATTIHRILQKVSQDAITREKAEWEACFEKGVLLPAGEKKTPVLYSEADSVWIHLQREGREEGKQKHYELKSAIAYEGWERLSQKDERYRLVNKRVYCSAGSPSAGGIPFWDGASLLWHKHWDLGYLELIVLGGDDAGWINSGVDELPYCVRQMDGFHLARSCRRGWKKGKDVYDAIRLGTIRQFLGDFQPRSGKTAEKERKHILKCLERGLDWRKKVEDTGLTSEILEGARGLGTMESNEDKLFADRMKKRGMSWTIKGAQRMGKAIELAFNEELAYWCGRKPLVPEIQKDSLSFDLFDQKDGYGKRTALPATEGPHASRQWVDVIRDLTAPRNLLN